MIRSPILSGHIGPILGAIRSASVPTKQILADAPKPAPFITISREPGAGALALARELVASLNRDAGPDEQWTNWDRELIEKVAADLHLSSQLVDSLEDKPHSWVADFFNSLGDDSHTSDETTIYARVSRTVRNLALTGRVVIVGCGGVLLTHKMPGGIHLRLVAPLHDRIEYIARECHLTHDRAAAQIAEWEHNRHIFYRRYWPDDPLKPDLFTLAFNTAQVPSDLIVKALKTLVTCHVHATAMM